MSQVEFSKIVFSFLHSRFFIFTVATLESVFFRSSDFRDTLRFLSHAGCLINRFLQTSYKTLDGLGNRCHYKDNTVFFARPPCISGVYRRLV